MSRITISGITVAAYVVLWRLKVGKQLLEHSGSPKAVHDRDCLFDVAWRSDSTRQFLQCHVEMTPARPLVVRNGVTEITTCREVIKEHFDASVGCHFEWSMLHTLKLKPDCTHVTAFDAYDRCMIAALKHVGSSTAAVL